MSIIEQIQNSNSEEEIIKLIEEHVIDVETSLGWREQADKLEREGDIKKAAILRAAAKRYHELDND